jgi:hypothetical protein
VSEEEDYQGKILGDRFVGCLRGRILGDRFVGCLRRRITKVRYWEIYLWGEEEDTGRSVCGVSEEEHYQGKIQGDRFNF